MESGGPAGESDGVFVDWGLCPVVGPVGNGVGREFCVLRMDMGVSLGRGVCVLGADLSRSRGGPLSEWGV